MQTLAYGTWPSPLSAADLAAGLTYVDDLMVDGDDLYWTELRPSEAGRKALVRADGSTGRLNDVGPNDLNARTLVHEYGGAPFTVGGGHIVASSFMDQRLWDLSGNEPRALTPEPPTPRSIRWADARMAPGTADCMVAVQERHEDEVTNEIVLVDLVSGTSSALVTGRDFVIAPRPSPDGTWLAWLAWDHPWMPWDAAELWVARLTESGIDGAHRIAGGDDASVSSLTWTADGRLVFTEDSSGFWEVHVARPGAGGDPVCVSSFGADVGGPQWHLGSSALAMLADGRAACLVTDHAVARLAMLDLDTGDVEEVQLPYATMSHLRSYGDGVAFIGAAGAGRRGVVMFDVANGAGELRMVEIPSLSELEPDPPVAIEVPTSDGAATHAFLHLPTGDGIQGPDDERPPLLVFTHGGPTGNAEAALKGGIAYWTTRGFAVADVNYRGSTGFGRAYRNALRGQWGVKDVDDTIAVARYLADTGMVDGARMAIRGGSAGGYTTLAVLTTPCHPFACGASFFGVADTELLAVNTHKLESRYLDQLIGPLPEARALYRTRSPLHRTEHLSKPILVLQGLEDVVVLPEQSEAIVAAAAARGIPHAYIAFEGEQHGFRKAENIITWMESELAFYGQVMGFDPAGDLPNVDLQTG